MLITTSLTFCQLEPTKRNTIVHRIASDILAYDADTGHVPLPIDTFGLAGKIIQHQLGADWFERSIQSQLEDTRVKIGLDDSDMMSAFICIVFVISCGLPKHTGVLFCTTDLANEPVSICHNAAVSVASHARSPPYSTSQRTRNSLMPGYSRQWHAEIRQ